MSEFIKGQTEERANAIMQVREILDRAESEARGLSVDDLGHVERLESRIADIDAGIAVARRQEERSAEVAEAAGSFVPAAEMRDDNAILRSIAMGEMRGHEFRSALTPQLALELFLTTSTTRCSLSFRTLTRCSRPRRLSTPLVVTRFRFRRLLRLERTRLRLLVRPFRKLTLR